MKRWISAILHKTPATAPQREAAVAPPAALHPDDDFFGAEDINGAAPVSALDPYPLYGFIQTDGW